jgi:hypothetical protein
MGMLKPVYRNGSQAFLTLLKDKNFRGLNRGFMGYFVVNTFMLTFAFTVQQIMLNDP